MRKFILIIILFMGGFYTIQAQETTPVKDATASVQETSEQLIQRQPDAYNARDITAFVATYADDIKLYDFPDKLKWEGKEELQKRYGIFFKNTPELHCELVHRIVLENKVIDEEKVTGFPDGRTLHAVAIYEVKDGLIQKVTFLQ